MKRRNALASAGTLIGGAFLLPRILMSCDPGPYKYALFHWGDTELLDEMAEFILPATEGVPGAKAAGVGDFVQQYVTDCFPEDEKELFLNGFRMFKLDLEKEFGKHFIDLSEEQKTTLFNRLEDMRLQSTIKPDRTPVVLFYPMLKNTILFGYFTSEPGATKSLAYVPVPGEQKGIIPYNGEKAWAL